MPANLLYLGFAFPPGLHARHPDINPAGHPLETQMVAELRSHFMVRSVASLPVEVSGAALDPNASAGVESDLHLLDRAPELVHRRQAFNQLTTAYFEWRRKGWAPEALLVYNFSPVYNAFIRWLRKSPDHPKIILLLADSSSLGQPVSAWKRFRYLFKPMAWFDDAMLPMTDAIIGLSCQTKTIAESLGLPFLWVPGGCQPGRARPVSTATPDGAPIRFGYFGALAPHAGIVPLARLLAQPGLDATLEIYGYGSQSGELAELAKRNPRIRFHGFVPGGDPCLDAAAECDVLVNPRPATHGNENNFPSKLFEYALAGRCILTAGMSGVDGVLGPEAFYFNAGDFEASLLDRLRLVARTPRGELARRAGAIQARVTSEFSWRRQGARMAAFIEKSGTTVKY